MADVSANLRSARRRFRQALNRALATRGFRLVRTRAPEVWPGPPADDADPPRTGHPRLVELRRRYASSGDPRASRSYWTDDRVESLIDLGFFRSDNLYVWQERHAMDSRTRTYLIARDAADRCDPAWFAAMGEDGAYGTHTHVFEAFGRVSRDLVDSIVELDFLARHVPAVTAPGVRVLDIGAGYGRLAHRASAVFPDLGRWFCTDAVPESTYLCEHYLAYRGILGSQGPAEVVPLDRLDARFATERIDLAVNVHSFSEMSRRAVADWLAWLVAHDVPRLLVVPNEPGDPTALESDGTRSPLLDVFNEAGYHPVTVEPVIVDPDIRSLVGLRDRLWLFARDPDDRRSGGQP